MLAWAGSLSACWPELGSLVSSSELGQLQGIRITANPFPVMKTGFPCLPILTGIYCFQYMESFFRLQGSSFHSGDFPSYSLFYTVRDCSLDCQLSAQPICVCQNVNLVFSSITKDHTANFYPMKTTGTGHYGVPAGFPCTVNKYKEIIGIL